MTQMRNGDWFDAGYFGHQTVSEHKSNYSRIVGGYIPQMAAPKLFAEWVANNLKAQKLLNSKRKPVVLEIGCASGDAVLAMRELGIEAYGIDVSEYILSRAKDEAVVMDVLKKMDMRDLLADEWPEFIRNILGEKEKIAAIVSKDVMEHVTEDLIDDVLKAFSRLAKWQFHVVNTGEHEYQAAGGDQSHFLVKPLQWWQDKAAELELNAIFKET